MTIKKGYIYNLWYQVISIVVPFITVPYTSRVLGPTNLGINAYTNSIVQYFTLIASLGVGIYGTRQIAYVKDNKEKRNKVFWGIFYTKFMMSIIVYFIFLIFIFVWGRKYFTIFLLQSIYIFSVSLDISWFYSGIERFDKLTLRNTIVKIVGVVLVFLVVKSEKDLIKFILVAGLSELIGQLIMWLQIKNYVDFIFIDFHWVSEHLLPMIRLYIPQFIIQIYTIFDKTIIGLVTTKNEVAYFDMSKKLISTLTILAASLGTVMLPRISSLVEKDEVEKIRDYLYKSFEFICYLSIPMVLGLIVVSDNFISFLLGSSFKRSALLTKIMAPTIFLISISNLVGIQLMIPFKKEKEFTISVLSGAIVSIVSNLVLVCYLKSIGAAISFLLSEAAVTMIQFIFTKNFLNFRYLGRIILKYFTASLTMGFVLISIIALPIENNFILMILQIVLGLIYYICFNFIFKSTIQMYIFSQIKIFLEGKRNGF